MPTLGAKYSLFSSAYIFIRGFCLAGQCQMGARCHFAHGKEELRQASDVKFLNYFNIFLKTPLFKPMPTTGNGLNAEAKLKGSPIGGGYGMPYSNYKTVKCKYYDQGFEKSIDFFVYIWKAGTCKYGENCSFAHGDVDMRSFVNKI